VIDGDYGSKINNARNKANAKGIELAISTKCFEYWVLLHFEENDTSTLDCDALVHTLRSKRHVSEYEKGKCDFRDIVGRVRIACARAEKLRKPGFDRGARPEDQNPCSEVYKLVKAMFDARE
jgi:RloB-like protein